jgi:copper transport protein
VSRTGARVALAAFFVAGVLALAPGVALAHALVRSSDPPDGALLQASPGRVVVTFTQAPDPALSSVHVLDETGKDVESGPSTPVPGKSLQLRVPLPASLPKAVYTVTWRVVSRVDGHVTAGSFSFGVGVQPGPSTVTGGLVAKPTTPSPPPLAVAGRWGFYWGLAVLLGGAAAGLVWAREGLPRGSRPLLLIAWVMAAAGLVCMIVAERSVIGVSLGSFLRSATGREFVERAVALAVAGVGTAMALFRPSRGALIVLAATVAAAMLIHANAGHAHENSPAWFNVGVQWVHLLAVGVWIGGLLWLLLTVRETTGEERASAIRRFSRLAGLALAVVAVTGLSRLLNEIGWPQHWGRLVDTSFGWALVVKIALVGVLVLLGAWNRYGNVPRASEARGVRALGRTVRLELVVAGLALAATAVMSELAPAVTIAAVATKRVPPAHLVVAGNDFATTVRVRVTVTPGAVGPNLFETRVVDYDTGRPVAADSVSLSFSLPGRPDLGSQRLDLSKAAAGVWRARGTVLSMDGRWSVTALIQEPTGGVEVLLTIQPRLPPEKITVVRAPGQPTLYTIALPGGGSVQTYVDPGRAGTNTVHFTFFTAGGDEQAIESAVATGTPPSGPAAPLPLLRLDPGHFVANTRLDAGGWRFQIQAATPAGQVFHAYFDQQIVS